MIIAYLSYSLAAFNSELMAPRYFFATPFTIITYTKIISLCNGETYLPFLSVLGHAPVAGAPLTPGLQVQRLLFRFYDILIRVLNSIKRLHQDVFPAGKLSLTPFGLQVYLLLVLVLTSHVLIGLG